MVSRVCEPRTLTIKIMRHSHVNDHSTGMHNAAQYHKHLTKSEATSADHTDSNVIMQPRTLSPLNKYGVSNQLDWEMSFFLVKNDR